MRTPERRMVSSTLRSCQAPHSSLGTHELSTGTTKSEGVHRAAYAGASSQACYFGPAGHETIVGPAVLLSSTHSRTSPKPLPSSGSTSTHRA